MTNGVTSFTLSPNVLILTHLFLSPQHRFSGDVGVEVGVILSLWATIHRTRDSLGRVAHGDTPTGAV